jgi:hypothetical protein
MSTCKLYHLTLALFFSLLTVEPCAADALGTVWTYQGELKDNGILVNGDYDFEMKLFDMETGGTQQDGTVHLDDVPVVDGRFTVQLDYGANAFNGQRRWLEIAIRPGASTNPDDYVTLAQRHETTGVPYALQTRGIFVNDAGNVGIGTTSQAAALDIRIPYTSAKGHIVLVDDEPSTDPVSAAAITGWGSDIGASGTGRLWYFGSHSGATSDLLLLNQLNGKMRIGTNGNGNGDVVIEADGDVGIGGTVTADTVDAVTQYDIAGARVMSVAGGNMFVGLRAGQANTLGSNNAFFGEDAGRDNTSGEANAIFGAEAGNGSNGNTNALFGYLTGQQVAGDGNAFFGSFSGVLHTDGDHNAFFGHSTGQNNTTGSENTFIGYQAGPPDGAGDLSNATAIGSKSQVTQSNSLVLGSINGVNDATADTHVGIGTTAPLAPLHIQTSDLGVSAAMLGSNTDLVIESADSQFRLISNGGGTSGSAIILAEVDGGVQDDTWSIRRRTVNGGSDLEFIHTDGNVMVLEPDGAVGVGTTEPDATLHVEGAFDVADGGGSVTGGHAIIGQTSTLNLVFDGNEIQGRVAQTSSDLFLNDRGGDVILARQGNVGVGTVSPSERLHVAGNICATGTIGVCSDARFKKNVAGMADALAKVTRLRGIHFDWRQDEFPDREFDDARQAGFIAQELKEVYPEAVRQGSDGAYSVDYGRLTPLLVEAIKEQQQENEDLKQRVAALEELVLQNDNIFK